MANPAAFFDAVRRAPFGGSLTQGQVDGMNALLGVWDRMRQPGPCGDPRHIAYVLATVYHETGGAMLPVEEVGEGRGHAYGQPDPKTGLTYYGRGAIQLTHADNYAKLGRVLDLDLLHHPSLLLVPSISAKVAIVGMVSGLFTGRSLADYFHRASSDPINARRIVNGTDRAALIASYYQSFLEAVHARMGWTFA